MCVMSMIMDHFGDKWDKLPRPLICPMPYPVPAVPPPVTPEEIEEFRHLLQRAREYDLRHGEPDCELEEKRERLRKLAKELGVEIGFIEPQKG